MSYTSQMSKRKDRNLATRLAIDLAGFGLIIISPFLGWIPGPGGIPVFLAGLGILSLNYVWAENLLKDFEKKRVHFVEKYLVSNKKVARTIDLLCVVIIAMAAVAFLNLNNPVLKLLSIGVGSFSLLILVSNQRRLDRLFNKFKKSKHKH